MDEALRKFEEFCASHNIEPTDRDRYMWLNALRSTHDQVPVAYGYFAPDGSLLQMLDFIEKDRRPKATPLYARPVAAGVLKPDVSVEILRHVWEHYYAPDDLMGMLLWLQRYIKS